MKFVLRAAFRSISRNKVRSILTTLGIMIGVAAVIAMVALGQGATVMIQIQIAELGSNLIMVVPGSTNRAGVRWGARSLTTLKLEDADAIREECSAVTEVAPVVRGMAQAVSGDQNWAAPILGTTPSYVAIRSWPMESGEMFTEHDVRIASKVCVVGKVVVNKLFLGADPVGQMVRIKKIPFKIIGTLKERGQNVFGDDQDDIVLVPISSAQKKLFGLTHLHTALASAASADHIPIAQNQMRLLLRQRHNIELKDDEDFALRTLSDLIETTEATLRILTILLSTVASISLVVGGVGVMNIMLVSVTERTREIGIRRAIGARRRDILWQFLVESVALSAMGGVIGVAGGMAITAIMSHVLNWPTLVSPGTVLVAFSFSGGVGVFFGFYPAHKAALLNPIEALRYE
ncbi:MAG: ABC transporter permease [Planctomycetota bacterium]